MAPIDCSGVECPTCLDLFTRYNNHLKQYLYKKEIWDTAYSNWSWNRDIITNPYADPGDPPDGKMVYWNKLLSDHVWTCSYKKKHTGNGVYQGAFAFTLTKAPTDKQNTHDMINAVEKIMSQKSCPVEQYSWYLEYKGLDDEGLPTHPHIHGMYETASGGRIESKHFKRAWPIWDEKHKLGAGHRGGYHRPVRQDEGYSNYIKKDGGIGKCLITQTD